MYKKLLFVVLSAVLVVGCDQILPKVSKKQTSSTETIVPIAYKGELLAQVGEWRLGTDDFQQYLDSLKKSLPEDYEITLEDKQTQLELLINQALLSKAAVSRGIDKENDVVSALANAKINLLAQKLSEKLFESTAVSEDEALKYYDENKIQFVEQEKRRVREIVVSSEQAAKDLYIRLLQGENFSILAEFNSIADTKSKGGDLGLIRPDKDFKFNEFWQQVVTTGLGSLSRVFSSPDGQWYIIKVEDIQASQPQPFYDVKDTIQRYLQYQKLQKETETLLNKVKEEYKDSYIKNDYLIR